MPNIFLKRIYDPYDENDGYRILIDRLWPRGIRKEDAKLTSWETDIAPSSELRKWFCHKPEIFAEFRVKYLDELQSDEQKSQKLDEICQLAKEQQVTLLYGVKDPVHNHAQVLKEALERRGE
jgi:uncharacterized protein YeaO (DUF488 family)